jgi:methylase of polypeptide subunit release factors
MRLGADIVVGRQQREDMKHAMVKMLCGQLHFAPIGEHPHEVLDIGTGTGIWAIESMQQYRFS